MTLFHYKTISKEGRTVEGTAEAQDKFSLYHSVKQDGSTVVFAEEVKKKSAFMSFEMPFSGSVKAHDKIIFARNLSKMIEAGLPITRALSILQRQSKGTFKKVISGLYDSLSRGVTFSDAMKDYPKIFSTLFVSMVRAGEESGNLSFALQNVGLQMEKSYQLTKKIKGAMMYPAVIFTLMIIIGVLMLVYMVPTLTATFIGLNIKLPLSTRIIIYISDFLKNYFLFIIIGVIAGVSSLVVFFRSSRGHRVMDAILLHLPVVGEITRQINSARMARTLSSLLSSGVEVVVALGVTKDVVQNSYYKEVLNEMQEKIQKGDQISTVLASHNDLYPLFVGEMVAVGEETGKIGEMLMGVAVFYEEEVDQKTKDMSSIIEPLIMIVIGVGVGFFAISMLGPTYSLADAL